MHKCHVYENLSPRILTDSPRCILLNSAREAGYVTDNVWEGSRVEPYFFFFNIVNERASFALHAHSFESPKLIVSAYN